MYVIMQINGKNGEGLGRGRKKETEHKNSQDVKILKVMKEQTDKPILITVRNTFTVNFVFFFLREDTSLKILLC